MINFNINFFTFFLNLFFHKISLIQFFSKKNYYNFAASDQDRKNMNRPNTTVVGLQLTPHTAQIQHFAYKIIISIGTHEIYIAYVSTRIRSYTRVYSKATRGGYHRFYFPLLYNFFY